MVVVVVAVLRWVQDSKAMTFPDRTCYPVASCNLKDFYNLIDVWGLRGCQMPAVSMSCGSKKVESQGTPNRFTKIVEGGGQNMANQS